MNCGSSWETFILLDLRSRNRPGDEVNNIIFNEFIDQLGLLEFSLKERYFTWSNIMFTSSNNAAKVCGTIP